MAVVNAMNLLRLETSFEQAKLVSRPSGVLG
jgi:hypothetical protein